MINANNILHYEKNEDKIITSALDHICDNTIHKTIGDFIGTNSNAIEDQKLSNFMIENSQNHCFHPSPLKFDSPRNSSINDLFDDDNLSSNEHFCDSTGKCLCDIESNDYDSIFEIEYSPDLKLINNDENFGWFYRLYLMFIYFRDQIINYFSSLIGSN